MQTTASSTKSRPNLELLKELMSKGNFCLPDYNNSKYSKQTQNDVLEHVEHQPNFEESLDKVPEIHNIANRYTNRSKNWETDLNSSNQLTSNYQHQQLDYNIDVFFKQHMDRDTIAYNQDLESDFTFNLDNHVVYETLNYPRKSVVTDKGFIKNEKEKVTVQRLDQLKNISDKINLLLHRSQATKKARENNQTAMSRVKEVQESRENNSDSSVKSLKEVAVQAPSLRTKNPANHVEYANYQKQTYLNKYQALNTINQQIMEQPQYPDSLSDITSSKDVKAQVEFHLNQLKLATKLIMKEEEIKKI